MSDEIEEGIENVPEETLSEELRGTVIDLQESTRSAYWITGGVIACIAVIFCSWFVLHATRTDSELLQEKLGNQSSVSTMIRDAQRTIRATHAKAHELQEAIDLAINATTTALREGDNPRSPYIPERYEAMITVLEGLLRLELEFPDLSLTRDTQIFIRSALNRMGKQELEYFDNGILERVPLIQTAALRQAIEDETNSHNPDPSELDELRMALRRSMMDESTTTASAAVVLGRWYRYHNDLDLAVRCFQIARRYVDGYPGADHFIQGKRPETLDALWEEYVAALEALAEVSFLKHEHRMARVYLARIFDTPESTQNLLNRHRPNRDLAPSSPRIEALRSDISVLKQAMAVPLELPKFPFYDEDGVVLDWPKAITILSSGRKGEKNETLHLIWSRFSEELQSHLLDHADASRLPDDLRAEVVATLNTLVRSPELANLVSIPLSSLSDRGKALLEGNSTRQLIDQERYALNREILDIALASSANNNFQLSDGTRLHNQLDEEQKGAFISLLSSYPTTEASRQRLLRMVLSGEYIPTLRDFDQELWHQLERFQGIIAQAEAGTTEQEDALRGLRQELKDLEGGDQIAMGRILELQRREQKINKRLEKIVQNKSDAEIGIKEIEKSRLLLTRSLHTQLQDAERQLVALEKREGRLMEQRLRDNGSLLLQVENQINLREAYLELLSGLQATDGGNELQRLRIEKERLDGEMAHLRERAATLTGDERELIDFELGQLEAQLYRLVKAFDDLFNPLREIVDRIAKEEENIWETERLLRQTHDDILALVGTDEFPGTLEEKAGRRQQLLLMKSDDILSAPVYDSEIHRLNEEIAEDHAKLHLLLETETLARETLHTFYPQLSNSSSLIHNDGDLAPLREYLHRQSDLMADYDLLWKESQLQEEIYQQEKNILQNLEQVSLSLAANFTLTEAQSRDLTRFVENILQAKNQLDSSKQLLRELHSGRGEDFNASKVSGSGYLMDNVDMFQIEHDMGLSLNEYRLAFEQRAKVVKKLQIALKGKDELRLEKLEATRQRDQQKIDQLIPRIAEKESEIALLSNQETTINSRLRQLADHYEQNLDNVRTFKLNLEPKIAGGRNRMEALSVEMADTDSALRSLVANLFQTATKLSKTITTVSIDDLANIDEVIAAQERELRRLTRIRNVKQRENYFKAKSVYLTGLSFYEESRLETLSNLSSSFNLDDRLWPELKISHGQLYADFQKGSFYTDQRLSELNKSDKERVHYETWVEFLEETALRIFQKDLPEYLAHTSPENRKGVLEPTLRADSNAFLANSRLLSGETYVKRALRKIRFSRAAPQDNRMARVELNRATTAFLSYLEFAEPLAYQESEEELTFTRMGSQEFPRRRRYPINKIDEARVYLGVVAGFKGAHHEAIGYYRDLLQSAAARLPERQVINQERDRHVLGQVDPVLLETAKERYHPKLYPFYASLLSHNNSAHETVYRLAKSYQKLADEEYQQGLANSAFFFVKDEENFVRSETYASRAIAYYTQLIATQSYSPFRKAALLQRARLRAQYGIYNEARDDLVAILGSPGDQGGSWAYQDITSKGDLPGELDPGYAHISFELGKLHLENQNFMAAAEAFMKAKEGDPDNIFVLRSKVAYAETLMATHNWLMASLLLTELVEEMRVAPEERRKHYPLDLIVHLATVQRNMGNLAAAEETLKTILDFIPAELVHEEQLDLSSPFGLSFLQTDFRDAIRPLALSAMENGEIGRAQRHYKKAEQCFAQAEKLFHMIPWREDRLLRGMKKSDFHAYQQEKTLQCRWERLKSESLDLLYASFSDYRGAFDQVRRMERQLDPQEVQEIVTSTLESVDSEQEQFEAMVDRLHAFYKEELTRLPEELERKRIVQQRELERSLSSERFLTYESLKRVRQILLEMDRQATAPRIANRFSKGSVEHQLLNEFVLMYSQQISLTRSDRAAMMESRNDLENLLAIPDAEARLTGFGDSLVRWIEQKMQETGLDDLFIPVSAQARILEEVDLYRVSVLSHIDSQHRYREMREIVDGYLEETGKKPSRLSQPQIAWQLIEIAAMTADFQMDWETSERYHRYLLQDAPERFFSASDGSDRLRAEFSLARSLIRLSQKNLGDLIFVQNPQEKLAQEALAVGKLNEAKALLKKLSTHNGESSSAVTTRIRAKQILAEVGT